MQRRISTRLRRTYSRLWGRRAPSRPLIVRKSAGELQAMREGGKITAACLRVLAENARVGITTKELDQIAEEFIRSKGGTPEFKGYQGFPASICASPNAMIVHGIPGSYRLKPGDI